MAGSFRHVVDGDNQFRGTELLDDLGDAYEALEEMYLMINYLTGGDKKLIFEAWKKGYLKERHPESKPGSMKEFWK